MSESESSGPPPMPPNGEPAAALPPPMPPMPPVPPVPPSTGATLPLVPPPQGPVAPPAGEPTPPPAGRKKSRTAWFIAAGAVVLVLVLCGAGALVGASAAGAAVTDYKKAVTKWQEEGLADLVATSTTFADDLWNMDEYLSDASLARQAEQCTELQDSADRLARAHDFARPQPADQPFGFLSAEYGEIRADAAEKAREIEDFRERAHTVFSQFVIDCEYTVEYSRIIAALNDAWDAVESTMMAPGSRIDTPTQWWECDGPNPCIPPDTGGRFATYKEAYLAYLAADHRIAELNAGAVCADTSLGPDFCSAVAAARDKEIEAHTAWIEVVDKTRAKDDAERHELEDGAWAPVADARADVDAVILEQATTRFPDLVASDYFSTDPYEWTVIVDLAVYNSALLEDDIPTE